MTPEFLEQFGELRAQVARAIKDVEALSERQRETHSEIVSTRNNLNALSKYVHEDFESQLDRIEQGMAGQKIDTDRLSKERDRWVYTFSVLLWLVGGTVTAIFTAAPVSLWRFVQRLLSA